MGYRPLTFRQKVHIAWRALRHPQTSPAAKGVLLAALAYTLIPLDILPDITPLLGMLDDLVVVCTAIALFLRWTQAIRSRLTHEEGF